jgi:hypothetical protein
VFIIPLAVLFPVTYLSVDSVSIGPRRLNPSCRVITSSPSSESGVPLITGQIPPNKITPQQKARRTYLQPLIETVRNRETTSAMSSAKTRNIPTPSIRPPLLF